VSLYLRLKNNKNCWEVLRDKHAYFKGATCFDVDIFYCKGNKLKIAKNVDGDFVVDVAVVTFYLKLKHNIFLYLIPQSIDDSV